MPAISVILPCYNVALYLDRCLTSLVSQTMDLSEIEIICVDDASTDDTWEKLKEWEAVYPETIMIIQCKENGKLGRARNIGFQYASGDWISFIDSDDWVEPDYFEKLHLAAVNTKAQLVCCGHIRDYSMEYTCRYPKGHDYSSEKADASLLILDSMEKRRLYIRLMSVDLTAWGKLIRRDILVENEIVFPEYLTYEDNYWGTLLHFYVDCVCRLELPLYHYFVNEKSITLTANASHHDDFLTVQLMKRRAFLERGFFEQYEQEINFDFLHSCYLDYFKIICLRFDPPSYSRFQLLRQMILEHLPDYDQNPYFKEGFTQFQHMLIGLLRLPVTRQQFLQIAEHVKKQQI